MIQTSSEPLAETPSEDPSPNPTGDNAPSEAQDPSTSDAPDIPPDSAIADIVQVERYQTLALNLWNWVQTEVLTLNMGIQLGLIAGAIIPAFIFGPRLKNLIQRSLRPRMPPGFLRRACDALATVATLIALWLTVTIFASVLSGMGQNNGLISAVRPLLAAAIFIRLVTLVIRSPFWSKVAFYVAWPIAALDAFGILGDVVTQLESASITLAPAEGDRAAVTLSALDFVRAGIIFAIFFWLASIVSSIINRQIQNVEELNPSLKAMLGKILNLVMPVVALVFALQMIGFNLASLAVFSGAVGLGIGLGLQKIIANFLAGFTLLADKSIKPGDVVEVDDKFGWVTSMKSRYVSLRTRDGHEHLVPNSIFIDEGVVNWSHSDRVVRLHAPFGVDYSTRDLEAVARMAEEVCQTIPRVVSDPKPRCNLMNFGESSVDFDLRFWITDPANGTANVKSDVMMAIWDELHARDINIPFRQLDVHIKSGADRLDLKPDETSKD
ncbi:MAG: mechanosensitive ion channel domain-containing protein [Pseudomonadota bacterium]